VPSLLLYKGGEQEKNYVRKALVSVREELKVKKKSYDKKEL
jgi:hypothetical protein